MRNGKPAKVPPKIEKEIESKFRELMLLKKRGINLFFTDIDKIKEQMLKELNNTQLENSISL